MNPQVQVELRRRDFYRFVRETFPDFIDGKVYEIICNRLRKFMLEIREKKSPRLIICLPPRLGKSSLTSIRFALFCLLNNPSWEIIVSSYSQALVNRLSRATRMLLCHNYIERLWPNIILADNHAAVEEWRVINANNPSIVGGTYRAVGRGSSITGAGAHCLVIDDILKDYEEADSILIRTNMWDWYSSVARTRLSPGGGVLVVQTRWHLEDLVGRLQAEQKANPRADQWQVLSYPAIAEIDEDIRSQGESILPERWPVSELERVKASIPPRWWDSLYQQRPISAGGNLFKEEYFCYYDSSSQLNNCANAQTSMIMSWDLRFGKSQSRDSSFVVGQVWMREAGKFFLIDQVRGRWSYAESRDELIKLSAKYPNAICKLIENKANGPALESDLQGVVPGIVLFDPKGDKYQRAERVLPLFLSRSVFIPENTALAKDFVAELIAFPRGANDDQVDAMSMALSYLYEETQSWKVIGL